MNTTVLDDAVEVLRTLVSFDTTSSRSNRALIDWACERAQAAGARVRLTFDASGAKANALLTLGPERPGGIVLSGHTDTVPVDGQRWSVEPFALTEREGPDGLRLHGRGTSDMKGFIAVALATLRHWQALRLQVPIQLALSFDEEVGALGVPLLIRDLAARGPAPAFVLVGEPTDMRLATSHKGFCLYRTTFTGTEAHSSLSHRGISAIAAAARFVGHLLDTGTLLSYRESRVIDERPRHTTFNVGLIEGGSAINIVAGCCRVTWECRPVPEEDVPALRARIEAFLRGGLQHEFGLALDAGIAHEQLLALPPLHADVRSDAVQRLSALLGDEAPPITVPFGTEAGLFVEAGWPAVVCGPGSIEQAHKADEYVGLAQLQRCVALMQRIGAWASQPLRCEATA